MAYQGLPTYARQGTQLSGTLSNQAPPPAPSGGMNPALAGVLGGVGGAALNSLGPNGNALGALIAGLKKLFAHRGGSGAQSPYGGGGIGDQGPVQGGWPFGGGGVNDQGPLFPNVTTTEDYGLYGSGGIGDQGPWWNGGGGDPADATGTNWWDE
jgi:hypothetical protein